MSDLIERLRANTFLAATHPHFGGVAADCSEAADRLEQRERELAAARALAGEAFMALTCIEETCIRFCDLRGRLHEFYSTSDQPPGVACPECGSVDPVDKDGHSAGCSRQAEQ